MQPYVGPGTPQMGQFRSFSNNPQYMPQQPAHMAAPMMIQPQFMAGPQGMVVAPQMQMYPAGHAQFIPPGVNVAAFSLLLTAIHVALSLIWFAALIALTLPLGRWLRRPRIVRALDRLTGCVFLAFGARLALAPRG